MMLTTALLSTTLIAALILARLPNGNASAVLLELSEDQVPGPGNCSSDSFHKEGKCGGFAHVYLRCPKGYWCSEKGFCGTTLAHRANPICPREIREDPEILEFCSAPNDYQNDELIPDTEPEDLSRYEQYPVEFCSSESYHRWGKCGLQQHGYFRCPHGEWCSASGYCGKTKKYRFNAICPRERRPDPIIIKYQPTPDDNPNYYGPSDDSTVNNDIDQVQLPQEDQDFNDAESEDEDQDFSDTDSEDENSEPSKSDQGFSESESSIQDASKDKDTMIRSMDHENESAAVEKGTSTTTDAVSDSTDQQSSELNSRFNVEHDSEDENSEPSKSDQGFSESESNIQDASKDKDTMIRSMDHENESAAVEKGTSTTTDAVSDSTDQQSSELNSRFNVEHGEIPFGHSGADQAIKFRIANLYWMLALLINLINL